MDALVMAAQIIAALAILVTLHELGHFAAARMFGIKVEKFYLFFDAWGFKLFSIKRGDTEYGIGWLPLGGYVKIAGMIDESLDSEQLDSPPQPWEFRSKPAWQRLIVMIGGVTVNFVLGFIIFILATWYYGETRVPISEIKYGIHAQSVGKEIGLRDGDVITGVNGSNVRFFDDLKKASVFLNSGNYYDVVRDGQNLKIPLPLDIVDRLSDKKNSLFEIRLPCIVDSLAPEGNAIKDKVLENDQIIGINDTSFQWYHEFKERIVFYAGKKTTITILRGNDTLTLPVHISKEGALGFFPGTDIKTVHFDYTFSSAIPSGTRKAFEALRDNIIGLKKLVSGKIDPRKSVQGPIGIATMFGPKWEWDRFWALTGLLSLILAFMNLLPIPALDGGHVLFLLIEMVIRRPLSDKFMRVMQVVGMVMLLSLMAFAFGNDLYRIIFR